MERAYGYGASVARDVLTLSSHTRAHTHTYIKIMKRKEKCTHKQTSNCLDLGKVREWGTYLMYMLVILGIEKSIVIE